MTFRNLQKPCIFLCNTHFEETARRQILAVKY